MVVKTKWELHPLIANNTCIVLYNWLSMQAHDPIDTSEELETFKAEIRAAMKAELETFKTDVEARMKESGEQSDSVKAGASSDIKNGF